MNSSVVAYTKRDEKLGVYHTKAYLHGQQVSECKLCINKETNTWSITAWYTKENYQHQGYGAFSLRATLKIAYLAYGTPKHIEYVWDGTNQYVMNFLEKHFCPMCKLPIAVQKYQEIDDWDAHIYVLNKIAVMKYFGI